jgi:serine phosphatase RsbU (regulator of sigma subunit)/anti-sigma regulatory factor (Ser/Thr protein kinase)
MVIQQRAPTTTLPLHAQRSFPADERSVAAARRFTRAVLDEWEAHELTDTVVLLVSELVTNAVVHAGTTVRLKLRLHSQSLRVEVEDQHPGQALPMGVEPPPDDAEHGRGLVITSVLAPTWGVQYTPSSKRVWLQLEREGDPSAVGKQSSRPDATDGDDAHVAVIEMSRDGVVTSWNDDAVVMLGWLPDEAVGHRFDDMLDPSPGERSPDELTASGVTHGWQGTYSVLHKDGSPARVFASHVAQTLGEGSVVLLVALNQRALLERPPRALATKPPDSDVLGLRDDALARLGLDDYLALAVERVRGRLSADAAYLLVARDLDDDFEVKAVSGLGNALLGTRLGPRTVGVPDGRIPDAPLILPDLTQHDVPLLADAGLCSLVMVPVAAEGQVIGALAVASMRLHGFGDDEVVLLQRCADAIAVSTDRARLQGSERERRDWLSFLAEAGDLIGGSLEQNMTMAITGQVVVPKLATWCAVHLDDDRGQPILEMAWHEDERLIEPLRSALALTSPGDVADSDDALLQGAVLSIPLEARGRQIGSMTLGRAQDHPLRGELLLVAESVARRAGLAIDHARAHGALRTVGNALQGSLLPSSMPTLPGLDLGVIYEAAGEGSTVGGDFYDVFAVGSGRWCFVVGDVCGTGAEAAAVTGLARHTIRALARAGLPTDAILERLNAAILDEGARSRFITLVCGTLRPEAGRVHTTLVSAGHPLPFVVRSGGSVEQIGTPQPLLGVLDQVAYTLEDYVLEPGDQLVAVTDGVLERRDGSRMFGEDGLAAELAHMHLLPAQTVADRVRQIVVDFGEQPQHDDVAILVIGVGAEL